MSERGTRAAETEQPDPLRLCCCHGHLDGLTLDEMSALGAPCPTAAYVRERMAQAFNEGVVAQREATRANGGTVGRIVTTNPYHRKFPASQREDGPR